MHVLAMEVELRLRDIDSLKAKRSVIKPIIEGARRRFEVSSAEVGHPDALERSALAFAVVSGSASHAVQVIDAVERFVWSFPEVEVTSSYRGWAEEE